MKESKFYQEIMQEGRVEQARADLAKVIAVRFGAKATEEFRQPVQAMDDPERLSELHDLALTIRKLSDFRRHFGPGAPSR